MLVIRQNLRGHGSLRVFREQAPWCSAAEALSLEKEHRRGRRVVGTSRGQTGSPVLVQLTETSRSAVDGPLAPTPFPPCLPSMQESGLLERGCRSHTWLPCSVLAEGGQDPPWTVLQHVTQWGSGSSCDKKSGLCHQQCRIPGSRDPQTSLSSPVLNLLEHTRDDVSALWLRKPCCA